MRGSALPPTIPASWFSTGFPNLASRVLGPSLRRLSQDMQALHGHPTQLRETFVDRSRFAGTCYRAANWRSLGFTRGYSRLPGGMPRWVPNGQPKEACVFDLSGAAPERLGDERLEEGAQTPRTEPPPAAATLRGPWDVFDEVVDFRKPRGQRHGLTCYLAIAVAARMARYRGASAFAEFACLLDDEQRGRRAFRSPSRGCRTVPTESTFRYIFSNLEPDALDEALRNWAHHGDGGPAAMDGKNVRRASEQIEDQRLMTTAAVEHHSGIVPGQTQVPEKSNEITAVRNLSRQLDLAGRTRSHLMRCTTSRKRQGSCATNAVPTMS